MSNFLKYMRLFALGITFSSSMALPYVQIKFYDVFREATQASNNELGLLMTIFTAVSMALYIPGGVLADRGSPKKLLLLSLIMMCGLNAYFAFLRRGTAHLGVARHCREHGSVAYADQGHPRHRQQ